MYLTRIAINTHNYQTLRALDNPEILHGIIENCFVGERQRNLWRLDELNGLSYLLLLSCEQPNLAPLAAQIGFPDAGWETKDYSRLMQRIEEGTRWRFRLAANPTVSEPRPGKDRGHVKAVTIAAHQREWLQKQGERNGFHVQEGQFDVFKSEWLVFRNKGRELSVLSALFEGVLTVTDAELFKRALTEGIGRAKAYGQGLITVMSYA